MTLSTNPSSQTKIFDVNKTSDVNETSNKELGELKINVKSNVESKDEISKGDLP